MHKRQIIWGKIWDGLGWGKGGSWQGCFASPDVGTVYMARSVVYCFVYIKERMKGKIVSHPQRSYSQYNLSYC